MIFALKPLFRNIDNSPSSILKRVRPELIDTIKWELPECGLR